MWNPQKHQLRGGRGGKGQQAEGPASAKAPWQGEAQGNGKKGSQGEVRFKHGWDEEPYWASLGEFTSMPNAEEINKGLSKYWRGQGGICCFAFFFYWSTVGLQHCVNFFCAAKWLDYTWIYSFSHSYSWWSVTGYWIQVPVLYSRSLLSIHPIHDNIC